MHSTSSLSDRGLDSVSGACVRAAAFLVTSNRMPDTDTDTAPTARPRFRPSPLLRTTVEPVQTFLAFDSRSPTNPWLGRRVVRPPVAKTAPPCPYPARYLCQNNSIHPRDRLPQDLLCWPPA